ncbi:MAG: chloride channel protein [Bowdeniella nasicola]|nr:chloride channel protein [Bowdeniella nasicola]
MTHHRPVFAALCALVGIGVGIAAVIFHYTIQGYERLMTGTHAYGLEGGTTHTIFGLPPVFIIAVPAISGLICGTLVNRYSPFARGHGVPEVMLAVRRKGGRIPGRVAIVKLVATTLTIGGGAPVGKEGPIVQVGASIGSFIGSRLKLSTRQLTLLAGAGAAGGIAATFNTPLAGAVFTLELILVSFTAETIGMVVIASVCGAVVAHLVLGDNQVVWIPDVALTSTRDLWLVVIVALVCGLAGLAFSRSIYLADDLMNWLYRGPEWARPAVGGLLIGVAIYFVPAMYGDVTGTLARVLTGYYGAGMLALLFILQMVLASVMIAMGGSGGVFGPTLFVGATTGSLVALAIAPFATSSFTTFAVIGMGAAFAAAARAPLTSVLIILEMTGQYALILPMMLAVVLATGLSEVLTRYTIYTTKLVRRGDVLDDPVEKTLVGRVRAEGLMGEVPAIVGPALCLRDAEAVIRESGSTVVPVVNEDGTYRGTLGALTLARAHARGVPDDALVADLDLPQVSVNTREFASVVLRTLVEAGAEGIAVVDANSTLVGWVAQRDLVQRIYRQQRRALEAAETESSWGSRISARIMDYRRRRDALEAQEEGRLPRDPRTLDP